MLNKEKFIRKTNQFLSKKFGLRIVRSLNQDIQIKNDNYKNNYIIEFIGVAGVGKSTIANKYKNKNTLNKNLSLKTQNDVLVFRNNNTIKVKNYHEKLFENALQYIVNDTQYDSNFKYKMIELMKDLIRDDFIMNYYKKNEVYLLDEHFYHHYAPSINFVSSDFKKDFYKNRIYIYCVNEAETIANQILKREKETGHLANYHKKENKEELIKFINKDLKNKEELYQKLKTETDKILVLHTQNNINSNLNEMDIFINKHINKIG